MKNTNQLLITITDEEKSVLKEMKEKYGVNMQDAIKTCLTSSTTIQEMYENLKLKV